MIDLTRACEMESLQEDFYLLLHEDKVLIYRPSEHLCALVSHDVAIEIQRYFKEPSGEFHTPAMKRLKEDGFFEQPHIEEESDISECPIESNAPFRPHEVTLDITWRCNLRCIYCYGWGGETPLDMDWDCALAAVDLCMKNCIEDNRPFALNFHGSGEPTQNLPMMKRLVEYCRSECSRRKIRFRATLATNGVMSEGTAHWIASNIESISLSCDGDSEAQDAQRPAVNGAPTSSIVFRTADYWKSIEKPFNLRLTITSLNVDRLTEICLYLGRRYPGANINVEPMTICGRAHLVSDLAPDAQIFAHNLVRTYKETAQEGIRVHYSGMRGFSRSYHFCSASLSAFSVMADGSVTACFSYASHEPLNNLFIYGKWDPNKRSFSFDQSVIASLRRLRMDNDPYCRKCFAKFHCIGDCPSIREYKLTEDRKFTEIFDVDFLKNRRCEINRTVLKLLLLGFLKN